MPKAELLVAMKMRSGRRADVRDIVALSEHVDWDRVRRHLIRGDAELLGGQLRSILEMLSDPKLVHALKDVFTMTLDMKRTIERTREEVRRILTKPHNP